VIPPLAEEGPSPANGAPWKGREKMGKNKMKAAVWVAKGEVRIEEWPIPQIQKDEVLIRISHTGICASDIHIIEGALPPTIVTPPRIPGHEFSGVVEALGEEVKGFQPGDAVVAHPNGPCGACYNCREGEENFCTDIFSTIRGPSQGSFAEYVRVKGKQVYRLPPGVSLREAALVEPAAIALHCVDRIELKAGQRVLVIGGGTIGLLTLQMIRLTGASFTILSEPVAFKREIGRKLGADRLVDPRSEDLEAAVKECTEGRGVDVCIEAVGLPKAIEQGFSLLRERGKLIVLGWPPAESTITISPFPIYRKELEIRGSFFSPYSFQRAIQMLPRLSLDPLITHCFDLGEIRQAIETMKEQRGIKILLKP
jgi:L-iditol 2-dehydrogenase